ncbi:DUF2184 domain-containing protein [Calorimonas adulescens]|uniref:DUF2184 domain-containing protein n=2 Tax=Calorimonas adulescens TaxID=2606906 RepID=A0A5D8QGG2_9THEO|nr:DUF2184 domain-containing protein [Calorimonas adulescens]
MPSTGYSVADYEALMSSTIPAALVGVQGMRFDSAEDASVFFARELDYIKSQSYDVEYPEFTALSIFPISSEVNPGAETVTYYSYDKTGMAKIISNYATDLPRADAKGKPTTAIIKSIGASYGYSVQEMRASRMAGKSLDVRKAEATRYQIDYLNNKIAWAGDEETGLIGVLSAGNNIPFYTIPANGEGSSTLWKNKTAAQILADINGMQAQVAKNTKNVERPDTLVLPADVYIDISTRQIDNTGYTIKRFVLENAPYLKEIVPAAELQSDATDTNPYAPQAVALLFKKDPRKITIENPLPFYQYPLQPQGLEVIVPCEARTAGAIIYYPLSLLIALGI